jgi:hypothetical protein
MPFDHRRENFAVTQSREYLVPVAALLAFE